MQEIWCRPACPGLVPPLHHPAPTPMLLVWTQRLPKASPLLYASLQSLPMLQRAPEPARDLPSRSGIQQALSSSILFLNPAPEGRRELSLLCRWCLKRDDCFHCASCTNQPNSLFQWQLMSLKLSWPAPPSLPSAQTVLS